MRSTLLLLAALTSAALTAAALAADAPRLPGALHLGRSHVKLSLAWRTTWASSDHKVRSLDDQAKLEAELDLAPLDGGAVEASATALEVTRRKHARIAGFFSDDEIDARGAARWTKGAPDPPPPWELRVSPRGETADVSSRAPLWHLEAWLYAFDRKNDEEARLRRLVHGTDVGFFGAPPLHEGDRFEVAFPIELGESGLTNAFVLVEATYALTVREEAGGLRVSGPLARARLVRGDAKEPGRLDQWIDVAFARGGPAARGELSALFDPAKGSWREASSSLALEYAGRFDGGSGRATFERTVRSSWE